MAGRATRREGDGGTPLAATRLAIRRRWDILRAGGRAGAARARSLGPARLAGSTGPAGRSPGTRLTRSNRFARTVIWLTGALAGGSIFLAVLHRWAQPSIPVWAAIVAVVGTLLCGDLAERSWQRMPLRATPPSRHGNAGDGSGRHGLPPRQPRHPR